MRNGTHSLIHNNKGFFHIHMLSIAILVLCLIGAWYVWQSYKQDQLKENLLEILNDYKSTAKQVIKSDEDKQKAEQAFDQLNNIIGKYVNKDDK